MGPTIESLYGIHVLVGLPIILTVAYVMLAGCGGGPISVPELFNVAKAPTPKRKYERCRHPLGPAFFQKMGVAFEMSRSCWCPKQSL